MEQNIPKVAQDAVLVKTAEGPVIDDIRNLPKVTGYDFNQGINYRSLLESFVTTGFQATNFGLAVEQINSMVMAKGEPFDEDNQEDDVFIKRRSGCTIFLGYTSNMVSSGVRDTLRYLVQHKMVDAICTTAGGVEEDLIKCLKPTMVGDFNYDGGDLREKGVNRIGNLLVPNDNYCHFEDWVMPILDQMLDHQKTTGEFWSPSKVITKLGQMIVGEDPVNHTRRDYESSICYWAALNNIPIFCPALTDGSLGDMIYFHGYKNPGLIIDVAQDIRRINTIAVKAKKTGMIILGGGVVKHHLSNANLMRNGTDYAVFINTANEFDGSDSGAKPDEAVSWGKIKKEAHPVKIVADATIVFPLLVAETFARHHHYNLDKKLC